MFVGTVSGIKIAVLFIDTYSQSCRLDYIKLGKDNISRRIAYEMSILWRN